MPLQWYKFEQRYSQQQQQQHQQQCQSQRIGGEEEEEWTQLPKNSGLVFAA